MSVPGKSQLASNIDTSQSMQNFLKEAKILNELSKGVQSMKSFVYPSVLQVMKISISVVIERSHSSAQAEERLECYHQVLNDEWS